MLITLAHNIVSHSPRTLISSRVIYCDFGKPDHRLDIKLTHSVKILRDHNFHVICSGGQAVV